MEEIWKPVKGFEEKYYISTKGRLKNIKTNHILKMTNKKGDYFRIVLTSGDKVKHTRIHTLVAEAFIPNPENKPQVNHIDCNKQNNCIENLEWVTGKENREKYYEVIGFKPKNKNKSRQYPKFDVFYGAMNEYNKNKSYKKYGYIYQFDKEYNYINKFYNAKEASIKTGVCARNILQCINHQEGRKQAGGFIWLKESEVIKNE